MIVTQSLDERGVMIQLIMRILSLTKETDEEVIREGVRSLSSGDVIAYPTESYYALGVQATDEQAVRRLFTLKRRPQKNALPVVVGTAEILESIVKAVPLQAKRLMDKYWPGPLTILFEAKDHLPLLLTGGSRRIAVRIPGEGFALRLATACPFAITATSANISSHPPAEHPDQLVGYFDWDIDLLIDAGSAPGGKPSTIVDATVVPCRVLREGRVRLQIEPEDRQSPL
jgi:L-threonylcarbamoyladenylate synthase